MVSHLIVTLVVMTATPHVGYTQDIEGLMEHLHQIVAVYMGDYDCHLVLMTTARNWDLLSVLHSGIRDKIVNIVNNVGTSQHTIASETLFGDHGVTCRGLILHLTNNDTNHTLRLLENVGLWKFPKMKIIVVGEKIGMETILLHHSFRNTIHSLYIAVHYQAQITTIDPETQPTLAFHILKGEDMQLERVSVYRKCLYCNNGKDTIRFIDINTSSYYSLFHDQQFADLRGHILRVVTVKHFPFMDYQLEDNDSESLTLLDSIDTRLLNTFAMKLNITFDIHVQKEGKWGIPIKGKFNGMMGEVQREEVDLCTISAPTPERLKALDYVRGYPSDVLILTSLKPTVLPENLALVRPFEDEVWTVLIATLVIWSVWFWLLEKLIKHAIKEPAVKFFNIIFYGWGGLVEQPPRDPSTSVSGQVLVGIWLVFCLIVDTGFRSSLVSHLAVKSKTDTIETFNDLVAQPGWKWGAMGWALSGAPLEFFVKNTDPVVQRVYREIELLTTVDEALRRVLAGGFSFISFSNYVKVAVASNYADGFGNSPFHLSREEVPVMAVFGWPVRSGAPFQYRFRNVMNRLEDTGITAHWKDEVIALRVQQNRAKASKIHDGNSPHKIAAFDHKLETAHSLVLGISHLQGAFYMLFIGSGIAFLSLIGEKHYGRS